mgnify:CR=1 FL=1
MVRISPAGWTELRGDGRLMPGRLFQRRVAEDDRRLLAMGGQGLAQPGQLLMRQFDS